MTQKQCKFSDSSNQGNVNLNCNEILLCSYQNDQNFNTDNTSCWWDCRKRLIIALGWHSLLESNLATSPKIKIKIHISFDLAVPRLGISPIYIKTLECRVICTRLYNEFLLMTEKTQNLETKWTSSTGEVVEYVPTCLGMEKPLKRINWPLSKKGKMVEAEQQQQGTFCKFTRRGADLDQLQNPGWAPGFWRL